MQAIATMNGVYCTSRPMRVSAATTKRNSLQSQSISDTLAMAPALNSSEDASNTTVFVGGIDQTVTEDQLKAHFSHVGEVVFVKIPPGRGCAFIQFANHYQALSVIQTMNGTQIGPNKVRLGWGKAPGSRSAASAPAYGYPYQQGISGYQYPYYGQYYQHQQSYDPYQQTGYQVRYYRVQGPLALALLIDMSVSELRPGARLHDLRNGLPIVILSADFTRCRTRDGGRFHAA